MSTKITHVNGRRLTVREAIFLATSHSVYAVEGSSAEPMTTEEVRAVVEILNASKSRDLNLDTARSEAQAALEFRTQHGY